MFGGDGDKSHLAMGLFYGENIRSRAAEKNVDKLHDVLKDTKDVLQMHAADALTRGCDRDAWRALALIMIAELQDPSTPRRFSSPGGDQARANLLQQVHRQSYERVVRRLETSESATYLRNAIDMGKKQSIETVLGYPEDVKPKQRPE